MMRCTVDWSALGVSADPTPGDPDRVLAAASEFGRTATSLGEAASNLRRLDSSTMCSEAVDKVVAKSRDVAAQLELVKVRYDEASAALQEYEPYLRRAQQEAEAAASEAAAARDEARRAADAANQHRYGVMAAPDDAQRTEYLDAYNREVSRHREAQDGVRQARQRLQLAIDERDKAGHHAADRIEGVVRDSLLNDSVVDRFKDLMDDVMKWLDETQILDKISSVMGTASTVLLVAGRICALVPIPVVSAIGGGMIVAGQIAGVVSIVAALGSGVVKGYRTGDWRPLAFTAAAALLPKVAGKVLGPLVGKGMEKGWKTYGGKIRSHLPSGAQKFIPMGGATTAPRPVLGSPRAAVTQAGTHIPGRAPLSLRAKPVSDMHSIVARTPTPADFTKRGEDVVEKTTEKVIDLAERAAERAEVRRDPYRCVRQKVGDSR